MEPRAADLAENGWEVLAWRLAGGKPALVVVEIGFTIPGLGGECFEHFRDRMIRFSRTLEVLEHPVIRLTFQRRKAQGRRHWAEFVCATPATHLPAPAAVPGVEPAGV